MDTKRYTPQIVTEENINFSIPLYQRLFSWDVSQVHGLLVDLHTHFNSSDKPYYLGMLSCVDNSGTYDLLDGQQRLTVLVLMGIVMRDYDERWTKFLNEGNRLNFTARLKDKKYLCSVIARDMNITEVNNKMKSALGIISAFFADDKFFSSAEERMLYSQRVFERLSFFFSILPENYSKHPVSMNTYFEAMNACGKGLEEHEILKVRLILNESNKEYLTRIWNSVSEMTKPLVRRDDEESMASYRNKYRNVLHLCREARFCDAFSLCESSYDNVDAVKIKDIEPEKSNVDTNRAYQTDSIDSNIISFPEFLMMVLDIHFGLDGKYTFYRENLLKAFDENKITDIQRFYNELLFYRLLLDYYIITKVNSNGVNNYTLLFKCVSDDAMNENRERLIMYQSMLYVSQQNAFYNWIKPILLSVHDSHPIEEAEYLNRIKAIDDSKRTMPTENSAWSYMGHIDRYWFWRLDYYLWERRNDYFKNEQEREIVSSYVFRANRSIEHLHPQNQDNNIQWLAGDIHSFGNLAMISQSFNSEQSDDPVTVKFARIKEQADNHNLESIKLYKMYLDAEKNPAGWTREIMLKHMEEMMDLLRKSFEK